MQVHETHKWEVPLFGEWGSSLTELWAKRHRDSWTGLIPFTSLSSNTTEACSSLVELLLFTKLTVKARVSLLLLQCFLYHRNLRILKVQCLETVRDCGAPGGFRDLELCKIKSNQSQHRPVTSRFLPVEFKEWNSSHRKMGFRWQF